MDKQDFRDDKASRKDETSLTLSLKGLNWKLALLRLKHNYVSSAAHVAEPCKCTCTFSLLQSKLFCWRELKRLGHALECSMEQDKRKGPDADVWSSMPVQAIIGKVAHVSQYA